MFPLLNIIPSVRVLPSQVEPALGEAQAPGEAQGQRNRRKCGHCREEGHTITHCPVLNTYQEELYHLALTQVQYDVDTRQGGYHFESWILNLTNKDTQYLVKKCQQPPAAARGRRRISDVESRTIIFDHFDSLDLGYVKKPVRLARSYYSAYRAVQTDVAHQSNGTEFQHFLTHQISDSVQRDIYAKILETRGLRDSIIEEREFPFLWAQWDRRRGSVLTNPEFIIHTHFAGIAALGYDFRVRNMPDYLAPPPQVPQVPQHRVVRVGQVVPPRNYRREELAPAPQGHVVVRDPVVAPAVAPLRPRDSLHVRFLENQLTLRFIKDGPNPVAYRRDYKIVHDEVQEPEVAIIVSDEGKDDCPVCLETKTPAHFLKMGCTHGFCNTCVGKIIATAIPKLQEVHCPLCRDELREIHYSDYSKVKTMFKSREETA